MRQHTVELSLALGLALAASPASADDHLARVNEVLLSHGGVATRQYVEIEDPANETFSAGGYGLFVYEADGTTQAHYQVLAVPSGAMRITIATADARTAFGLTPNGTAPDLVVNLSDNLPANGTACFRKSGVNLHCLTWGTATPPAGPINGQVTGPAPADGESLQRQASNCAAVGAPTPNAANATLQCPTPGADAGTNPDAPTNGGGPDGGGNGNGPDDGGGGGNNEGDDSGGCCSTGSAGEGLGFTVLAGASVLGLVLRRRRRSA